MSNKPRVEENFRWKPESGTGAKKIEAHLPNVTVKLSPIIRQGLIPKDHLYSFQAPNTTTEIPLLRQYKSKSLHNIFEREGNQFELQEAERKWLERKLGKNLNPFDEKSDLQKYKVKIGADIKDKPIELRLNDPVQYLDFLILSYSGIVTPINQPNRKSIAGVRYYMETEEFEKSNKKSSVDYTMKAFMILGEIQGNVGKMRNLYKMLTAKTLDPKLPNDKILGKLQEEANADAAKVVNTYNSPLFEGWDFILNAMEAGAIIQHPKDGYKLVDGQLLAFEGNDKADLQTAISFLQDPTNQVIKADILAKIKVANK